MSVDLPDAALAELILRAAFNPELWAEVCDGMARLTGSKGAIIFPMAADQVSVGIPHSERLSEAFARYVSEGWPQKDVRFAAIGKLQRQPFITDADCLSYDEYKTSEFYQDFLAKAKCRWFAAFSFAHKRGSWHVSLQQGIEREAIPERELNAALAYSTALGNAAAIASELGFARVSGAVDALDAAGRAAIAVGWGGRVIHCSRRAEQYIGPIFQISQGILRATCEKSRAPLEKLVNALWHGQRHLRPPRPVVISQDGADPAVIVHGLPLPDEERLLFRPAHAILAIVDPQSPDLIQQEVLIECFGLTPAECRLACSLLAGKSAASHATELLISPVTARNHLQSLLRKTGSHSKIELIMKLRKTQPF